MDDELQNDPNDLPRTIVERKDDCDSTSSQHPSWLMLAVFLVVGAVTLFYKLGDSHTLGSHEVFIAVPARE